MGFDPRRWGADTRQWGSDSRQPRRVVTGNIDALLAENEALRRELDRLRRRLELLERQPRSAPEGPRREAPRITVEQVQRWGDALARQSGWRELRLGGTGDGLRGVIDALNRRSLHPDLTLEQRLDRLTPGLGQDLHRALAGPPSRKRFAILAAFALYGVSALEWLEDDPRRVVADLRQWIERLDAGGAGRSAGRRTRSDRRPSDRDEDQQGQHRRQGPQGSQGSQGSRRPPRDSGGEAGPHGSTAPPPGADPRRVEAYRTLGLAWGASRQAIKTAHRRLVKQHHPDVGGRAEDFHRINAAYQLLLA